MKLRTKYVMMVVICCFILRLVFFLLVHPWTPESQNQRVLQGDALGYHHLAITLLESHRFAYGSAREPETIRTPLFPLYISTVYWLFGTKPWIVILGQIILNTISCLLILLLFAQHFGARIAVISSIFFALEPLNILFSCSLYSEVFFVFFLVAAFYVFGQSIKAETGNKAFVLYAVSGILMGLATLARPITVYFPLVVIIILFVNYRTQVLRATQYAITYLLFFILTLSPWLIRNHGISGRYSVTSHGSQTILVAAAYMEADKRHKDVDTVQQELKLEADQMMVADGLRPQDVNPFVKSKYWQKLGMRYIKADPVDFGRKYLFGVAHIFTNLGTSLFARMLGMPIMKLDIKSYANIKDLLRAFFKEKGGFDLLVAAIIVPFLLVCYLAMAVGLLVSWGRFHQGFLLFCLLSAMYFVMIAGIIGFARYKLPAIPFYLPFVGIGFDHVLRKVGILKVSDKAQTEP